MPELPDVEVFRKYMDSTALHQEIEDVELREAKRILKETTQQDLKDQLIGREFSTTRRHGKHLFAGLTDGIWLMMHFGMTGFLKYFENQEEAPDHIRALYKFTNGYNLAYDCQRKLGQLKLVESPEKFAEENNLGPDVLSDEFDFDKFLERLESSRAMIKSALMNQKLMAGIGNIYSDEILFKAGVHPKAKAKDISEKVLREIYSAIHEVLREAIDSEVEPERMPSHFLLPNREEGGECPQCGGEIEKIKVSGRSSYVCPGCQQKP
ncbi:MAG: DNA-formamidopyrimidine glycosylase [Candidatus Bipolaricaulia bacterium]